MRRIRKKHSGLLGSYYLWEKNNKIIRLSTIFQPLISSGRITHGKKLHRHLAEPCYFSPPCCSGLPVLPEAGAGPKATSAHTSSVGKQAWPLVNKIKPKKNMQVLRSRVVPSTLPLCKDGSKVAEVVFEDFMAYNDSKYAVSISRVQQLALSQAGCQVPLPSQQLLLANAKRDKKPRA